MPSDIAKTVAETGDVHGIRYWICQTVLAENFRYWTVYVDVSDIVSKNSMPIKSEAGIDQLIDIHGGCTFLGKAENVIPLPDNLDMTVAGWDYMHSYDQITPFNPRFNSKQTLDEVRKDVRFALESFLRGP